MNIAICISGHLSDHSNEEMTKYLDSLSRKLLSNKNKYFFFVAITYDNHDVYSNYIKRMNPKKVVEQSKLVLPILNYNITNKRPETNITNSLNMFWKIKVCDEYRKIFEVEELKDEFDLVIRLRPDLEFIKRIPIKYLLKIKFNLAEIYAPYFPWYINDFAVADFFAVGNSTAMGVYSSVFDEIEKYILNGLVFHPESVLGYHLDSHKISLIKGITICKLGRTILHLNGYRLN